MNIHQSRRGGVVVEEAVLNTEPLFLVPYHSVKHPPASNQVTCSQTTARAALNCPGAYRYNLDRPTTGRERDRRGDQIWKSRLGFATSGPQTTRKRRHTERTAAEGPKLRH